MKRINNKLNKDKLHPHLNSQLVRQIMQRDLYMFTLLNNQVYGLLWGKLGGQLCEQLEDELYAELYFYKK